MHALVSIHDVMPHTLDRVWLLTGKLAHLQPADVTLLVVPGLDWSGPQLDDLHGLAARGYTFAGHGWHHTTREIRGLYHRVHSTLVSRRAAEHLALDESGIRRLINECYLWFTDHGFPAPDLYVPPAWAMGSIRHRLLQDAPFRYYENTAGLYDSDTGTQVNLPLAGFEADNLFRAASLCLWNRVNRALSSPARPLRLSIHPADPELLLGNALDEYLSAVTTAVHYRSVF